LYIYIHIHTWRLYLYAAMWPCITSYTVYAVLDYIIIIILEQLLLLLQRLVILRVVGGVDTPSRSQPNHYHHHHHRHPTEYQNDIKRHYGLRCVTSRKPRVRRSTVSAAYVRATSVYLSGTRRRSIAYRIPRSRWAKLSVRRRSWYTIRDVSCIRFRFITLRSRMYYIKYIHNSTSGGFNDLPHRNYISPPPPPHSYISFIFQPCTYIYIFRFKQRKATI